MSEAPSSTDDVLAKANALLNRHQPGTAQPSESMRSPFFGETAPADEASFLANERTIPILTEVVAEADSFPVAEIPVLTDVVDVDAGYTGELESMVSNEDVSSGLLTEEAMRQLENRLVLGLENRIAPQLSAAFDQALTAFLENARTQIEQAVRATLAQESLRQTEDNGPAAPPGRDLNPAD